MHPRAPFAPELRTLPGSAKALGYRMPAEWEPLERVWLTPPHNPETWPGCFEQAQAQFGALMEAMKPFVAIATTQALGIATNDSWIRDYGPIFVVRDRAGFGTRTSLFGDASGADGQSPRSKVQGPKSKVQSPRSLRRSPQINNRKSEINNPPPRPPPRIRPSPWPSGPS